MDHLVVVGHGDALVIPAATCHYFGRGRCAVLGRAAIDFAQKALVRSTIARLAVRHLRGEVVDVRVEDAKQVRGAGLGLGEPPAVLGVDHARLHLGRQVGALAATAPTVLNPAPVAFANSVFLGGLRVHVEQRVRMKLAHRFLIATLRVEELPGAMPRRDDDRILLELLGAAHRALPRLFVLRQRVEPKRRERGRI